MSDTAEPTPTPEQALAATPEPEQAANAAAEGEGGRIPLDRFRAVTDENKTLREQLDQLTAWKEEQEQAQLSELERERQAREKAEAQASEAAARVEALERSSWIRSAALAAGFTDADDAVALIDLGTVADAEAAGEAVKALAERKPHLLTSGEAGPQQMGSASPAGSPVPLDADGQPDLKAQLGRELLQHIRKGQ